MERLHQLLGLLLVCFRVTGASIDCSAEQRTVTVQLSRADVLRTWQPSGAHCRWWESRQSETNRFPAAVRSGPRWLVMQLRQPMMLEAVSLRDWDGQWHVAALVGSPVSAVGASSLPLELQLEDPCRASWETFSTRGRWKRVVAGSQALISFIRLTSESSLSWQALSITGRQPPVRLNARLSSKYLSHSYGLMVRRKVQSRIALFIDSCIGNRIVCWLLRSEGRLSAVHIASSTGNQLQQTGVRTAKFELVIGEGDHDSVAQCALAGDSPGTETVLLEEPLLWEVPARTLNLSVSQILIIGFEAVVSLTSESFPEARHRCSINRSRGSHRNLSITRQKISRAIDLRNRAVIRVQSEFRFTLEAADLGGEIVCSGEVVSNPSVTEKFPLLRISEPCQTTADLGERRHWQVGEAWWIVVTSKNCSIWNVSHSCQLIIPTGAGDEHLLAVPIWTVQVESFSSTHALLVNEAMSQNRWKILCSINQSAVAYPDLEVRSASAPAVFGAAHRASLNVLVEHLCSNTLKVQASVKYRHYTLPVTNVTCQIVGSSEQDLTMQRTSRDTWSALTTWSDLGSQPNLLVRCMALQLYFGELVFKTTAEASVTAERCFCANKKKLIHYAMTAAAAQLFIIVCVAVITWKLASSRIRRPTARDQTARTGRFAGQPAVPLQPLAAKKDAAAANTAATCDSEPYDVPTSDRGTANDSAWVYERASGGSACSSSQAAPPLPPSRYGDEDGGYINWKKLRQS
ncbi:hypothetical protein BOX15_Mlig007224g1 [Macrostomum lignano]|uniref:Uncharacterized protein n=1 Tax=Macrostomum lignano TaxID=282301 RepID=A0A267FFD9_9PLAT|nr:hypothetical protein BOX15_Mlig007224g1 [Macrostomum lignano]